MTNNCPLENKKIKKQIVVEQTTKNLFNIPNMSSGYLHEKLPVTFS